MAKVKKAYFCKECGYEAPKWMGRCPACGEWNSFTEEIVARESGSVPAAMTSALPRSTPQRVGEIRSNDRPRLDLGNAEVNRGPFDLPEAESELTAGYHTEYSGMHFGLFYVAEFVNLFVVSGVAATIFLGGWMPLHIPGWEGFNAAMDYIPGFVWFFGKAFFVVWLLMWIKWTFPRLRIDQILTLEWKYLVPIGLANLLLMVIVVVFKLHF